MLQAMLKDARGGPVTVRSACSILQPTEEGNAKQMVVSPCLGISGSSISCRPVSFLNTADTGGGLTQDVMIPFYEEERIPERILNNNNTRTLMGLPGLCCKTYGLHRSRLSYIA
ncbi:hypothetical protein BTJ68_14663 [Hortaea werneckii EXF-2000]|uniref:Uncharacterized protein n=1 Tax=Hortaea werneckii EXF-2000 TaxID=1157616 RepID=A0A1Z5SM33_HORWE|nr:hypothetical protein BTJ68_14663 [Hortaea werneckii EXF-2000]